MLFHKSKAFVVVFGVADPRNSVLGSEIFCDEATEHVQLVGVRDRDEKLGVFDSGFGGLTAARQLRRIMPSDNIIYFGDTARVPYGGRSRDTLLKYARQDMRFLSRFDLKAVLIACGTVSSNCLTELAEGIARSMGVEAAVEVRWGHPGVINDPEKATLVRRAVEEVLGKEYVVEDHAGMVSEDFGCFLEKVPGCFYHVGVGGPAGLHSASFCPEEWPLVHAAAVHAQVVWNALSQG